MMAHNTGKGGNRVRIWGIPGQVTRLLVLFLVAVVVLLVVRQRFVPESFGEIGHYRADVIEVIAAQEPRYAGIQVCVECHTDVLEVKSGSYHRGLTCEGCHGASQAHAGDPTSQIPHVPRGRENCLRCHGYLSSRPTGFPQVVERVHNPMEACVECHDPHDPVPPETPDACSACHAAIERTKAVSHHRSVDCETCHQTPPEHMVDPRASRPGKPASRRFCARCHGPDAEGPSSAPRVDVADHGGRYLCWQCHYPHYPEGR